MTINRSNREWDFDQEQIKRLREIAPDSIKLFMAGLNGMGAQFSLVLNTLRKEIDALGNENKILKQDVEHLRKEVADMRILAVTIQALIGQSK